MNISSASAESLSFGRRMIALGLVFIIIFLSDTFKAPITANAETYTVTPEGNLSLSEALSLAGAGDIIFLTDGKYTEPIVTVGGGEEGNPLKIVGTRAAVISGQFRNRCKTISCIHTYVDQQPSHHWKLDYSLRIMRNNSIYYGLFFLSRPPAKKVSETSYRRGL